MEEGMVAERRGGHAPRGSVDPSLLLTRALGTIDRMAEAMWQDDAQRRGGKPRAVRWEDENTAERELWTRRSSAAFLTLLEPHPE